MTWLKSMALNFQDCEVQNLGECKEYIADDRYATPEYFEYLKNMTAEEFAQHIEGLKNQED